MSLMDWINPPELSQESQLSQSQKREREKKKGVFNSNCNSATATPATPATQKSPVVSLVQCRDCQHFEPDQVNPPAGLGNCRINADGDPASPGYRAPWPTLPRRCNQFEVTRAAVFRECKAACKSLQVDPSELCDWLINQADPGWLVPAAVRRWAELIAERGFPE
jgi:hypothetical protein